MVNGELIIIQFHAMKGDYNIHTAKELQLNISQLCLN